MWQDFYCLILAFCRTVSDVVSSLTEKDEDRGKRTDRNSGSCNGYIVVTVVTNPDRLLLEVKDENGNIRLSYVIY